MVMDPENTMNGGFTMEYNQHYACPLGYPASQVGYASATFQQAGQTYGPEQALAAGTLYPELDLPYGVYQNYRAGSEPV